MNNNPSNPYQIYNPETVITLKMLGDIRDRRLVAGLSGNASGPQIVNALEEEIKKLRKQLEPKPEAKPEPLDDSNCLVGSKVRPVINPVIPGGFKL
jgi:hypothetical protein